MLLLISRVEYTIHNGTLETFKRVKILDCNGYINTQVILREKPHLKIINFEPENQGYFWV